MEARSKTHLREFQARLNERLRQATTSSVSARLGMMIAQERYLVDLSEAGEIVPVPANFTPVPLAHDWFRGLVNLRGNLFAVSDLSRFCGREFTTLGKESRLLALSGRLNFNAALLVSRMLGLHNLASMSPAGSATTAEEPWRGERFVDGEGREWIELSLSRLAVDERFLMVNR